MPLPSVYTQINEGKEMEAGKGDDQPYGKPTNNARPTTNASRGGNGRQGIGTNQTLANSFHKKGMGHPLTSIYGSEHQREASVGHASRPKTSSLGNRGIKNLIRVVNLQSK